MRVLVTGHNGYIGTVMTSILVQEGFDVVGLDTGYYRDCTLVDARTTVPEFAKDIRDIMPADLEGIDAVVHLAALSNDPIGNLNSRWTQEINFQASVNLAKAAKAAGVQRFLFSSSCIMYGLSEAGVVREDSPLDPRTEYARSKVSSEQAIAALAAPGFSPTFMRNGTVYGVSPRMRFDTVLNDLVGSALTTGKVVVYSDGSPWRPVVHVEDVSRAFVAALRAPVADVHNQAINTGADFMNCQVRQLAEMVVRTVPGSELQVLSQPGADQRTYITDFSKFAQTFPDFRFKWTVEAGAQHLYEGLSQAGLTHADFVDKRFTRLKWLQHLLDTHQVDDSLRWAKTAVAASDL